MARQARITGTVEYREGEGTMITIPQGPCEIEEGEQDVTLSWSEGDTHGSTAMPLTEFKRYLSRKAIELD